MYPLSSLVIGLLKTSAPILVGFYWGFYMFPLVFLYTPQKYTNDSSELTAAECESPADLMLTRTGRSTRHGILSDVLSSDLPSAWTSLHPDVYTYTILIIF